MIMITYSVYRKVSDSMVSKSQSMFLYDLMGNAWNNLGCLSLSRMSVCFREWGNEVYTTLRLTKPFSQCFMPVCV